jgi:hypothetical protein
MNKYQNVIETESYNGFIIEPETDPWCLKYKKNVRFFRAQEHPYWEVTNHAETIEEAKELIDELNNKS